MTLLPHPHTPDIDHDEPAATDDAVAELAPSEVPAGPAEHEIATEAYTRYLLRGCQDGHAVEDWLEAERTLRTKHLPTPPQA